MKNPELRAILSTKAKKRFQDPEARRKASRKAKEVQNKPEVRAKRLATLSLPEYQEKVSRLQKDSWKNKSTRDKRIAGMKKAVLAPGFKTKLSIALKQGWRKCLIRQGIILKSRIGEREFTVSEVVEVMQYQSRFGARTLIWKLVSLGLATCLVQPVTKHVVGIFGWNEENELWKI